MSEPFKITKIDTVEHLVFGFANVSIAKGGKIITDLQGDRIAPDELEKAAYDYVLTAREADEMHEGGVVGHLVESVVFTPEKIAAMLTDPITGVINQEACEVMKSALPPRWWVGFKLDPSAFAKVQSGEYKMLSIAGTSDVA